MLIMSMDAEKFEPFDINRARAIAEENGFIYIATLVDSQAFKAADWMVDGKHDTVIVSEEDMKKHGKPYAPVTPLTNVILPFKKITNCPFLYKKGTVESPVFMSSKDIDGMLSGFLAESLSDFDHLEVVGETEFELYGEKLVMDKNESRCAALDKSLGLLDPVSKKISDNAKSLEEAGYKFDLREFNIAGLEIAAEKCGIPHDYKSYEGITTIDGLKDRFRKNVSEKNSYGFKYTKADEAAFDERIKAIEGSSSDTDALKKEVAELLTVRPANGCIFNLARALSPADAENVENISEYWGIPSLDLKSLTAYLESAYVSKELRDDKDELICGPAKAKLVLDELCAAAEKYKVKNLPAADKLRGYIDDAEKAQRTYNGTLFDSVEEMNKAQENEKKIIEECGDVSALNESELDKLAKYIHDINVDKKTKGKYLLKVKLAKLDVQKNQAEQLLIGMGTKKIPELEEIKKKLSSDAFDEVIAKPYIARVDDSILTAQSKEVAALFASIPDKNKADELEKVIDSGKFNKIFNRSCRAKIAEARDGFARKELDALTAAIDKADTKTCEDIRKKIGEAKCRSNIKAAYYKKVAQREAAIEIAEVEKTFAGIAEATREKVAELKKVIESGKFRKALTEKYVSQLDKRIVDIDNAEFIKKCETIPTMDKDALAKITEELKGDKYPKDICEKYLKVVADREKAILKAEVDKLAADVAKMDFAKLDELEKKLSDEKYPKDITEGHIKAIAERRKTLYKEEVDGLCKNISTLDKKAALELRDKLGNEKYDKEYVKKYLTQIEERVDKIELDKVNEMTKTIDKLDKKALEKLSADIKALGFAEKNTAAALEKIHKCEIEKMKAELESLCKNIPNTPREELKKIREALSTGDFDKELSKKYIEQIDKRTEELIKKELSELCKNIAGSPKDKLLEMKKKIADTPEYADYSKQYTEQIDNRIKTLDKAEFDKQMAEISSLDREKLTKFVEDLEKRKATFEPKRYEEIEAKCKERSDILDKHELEEITKGCESFDIKKLHEVKEKITDGGFALENTYPFMKKVNDAINNRHVEYFSKLTANIKTMNRAELIVLLEKINKNETGCPDDMLQRYVGMVKSKIRDADRAALDAKCLGIRSFSEFKCYELIKDINDMDIDPDAKKDYTNKLKLQITNIKTLQRDEYVRKFTEQLIANSIPEAVYYKPDEKGAATFDKRFQSVCSAFASLSNEFEMGIAIYEAQPDDTTEAYMITPDFLYYNSKNGFDHIPIEKIEKFEGKNGLFKKTVGLVEKGTEAKTHELPHQNIKDANNLAKALNGLLNVIQKDQEALRLSEAEERRKVAEEKQRETEEQQLAITNARKKAEEEAKLEAQKAIAAAAAKKREEEAKKEAPKTDPKAAVGAKPITAGIKPIKPIEVVVTSGVVKPAVDKPVDKPADKPAAPAPAIAKPAAPAAPAKPADKPAAPVAKPAEKPAAPAASKPEAAPAKPAEKTAEKPAAPAPVKPAEKPAPAPAPTKPADKPAPAAAPAKPAEEKPKIKFCDQCGAKITNESAKFCMECGNKLIK